MEEPSVSHMFQYHPFQASFAGHAFVLDGYHPDGTYHFNFGWSGQENGWFDITSPSGYEWYYHQGLVRRIFPGDASYPYGCDQSGENTNLVGSIEDGSGPCTNYIDNANCQWLINPQNEYDSVSTIRLSFVALDTDPDDIITLFDGESTSAPVIGTFSGTTLPSGFFYSTGNKMLITLEGDGDDVTGCGFRAEYMSNQPSWCSSSLTTYTDPMGSFDDGSGTWYYKNQSNCMWKLLPQYAMGVTLTFTEFDTEEGSDFLKIYDASNNQLLATYSGHYTAGNMPDPIYTASGQLFLIWQTDGAVNAPGWSADWETGNVSVQENIEGLSNVKIYPNPAESFVNVSFRADTYQTFTIRVISTDGHVVYTEKTQNFLGNYINSINLSGFAKGVYFLSLVSDRGNLNKKLIVK